MQELRQLLDRELWRNSVREWLIALGVALAVFACALVLRRLITRRLNRFAVHTRTHVDDALAATVQHTKWFFFFAVSVYVGSRWLELREAHESALRIGATLLILLQVGIWFQWAIRGITEHWRAKRTEDPGAATIATAVTFILQLLVWSLLLLFALSNLGVEIGALVAGLGMGGVAAALAVQSVFGDLIASLSIYFDRPFDLGDFIIVGSEMGTVEKIGLRSTRLRSLGGEQLVFSNTDLTRSRIRNYKRMSERRIVFEIRVEYNVSVDLLERIPQILREEVSKCDGARFDRAHFKTYGDYALVFEVVWYVLSADYNTFMDVQQSINFGIYRRFADARIPFAFPSSTLYLRPEAPLRVLGAQRGEARGLGDSQGNGSNNAPSRW